MGGTRSCSQYWYLNSFKLTVSNDYNAFEHNYEGDIKTIKWNENNSIISLLRLPQAIKPGCPFQIQIFRLDYTLNESTVIDFNMIWDIRQNLSETVWNFIFARVWFSLRGREVSGSNPRRANTIADLIILLFYSCFKISNGRRHVIFHPQISDVFSRYVLVVG